MQPNRFKRVLTEERIAFGAALQIDSPLLVEMLAIAGFDYVMLDGEHGYTGRNLPALITAADAAGITAIARVPDHGRAGLLAALEMGAGGVLAPMVNTAEQAAELVRQAKYAPLGARGFSMATRPAQFGALDRDTHARTSNEETLLIITLETRAARANACDIAGVPGVDLMFIGRDDLSESLGALGDRDATAVDEAIRDIVIAAGDTPVGTTAFRADDVRRFRALGVRFFLTGTSANIRMAFEQTRAALLTGLDA